jgi:pilus assembly protein Flp/PilA
MHIGRHRLFRSEAGVTAIEYGLIAALIAMSLVAGISLLGSSPASVFDKLAHDL